MKKYMCDICDGSWGSYDLVASTDKEALEAATKFATEQRSVLECVFEWSDTERNIRMIKDFRPKCWE